MGERGRIIVPLDIVADHRRGVLHAVIPFSSGPARGGVHEVAEDDVDGHAVAVSVVNCHRSVLEADRTVSKDAGRLAFDLCVAVGHGDR